MSAQKGTASTRLLGMKFMQRAAAAETHNSAPSTPDGRPAKRARLSNGNGTPMTPGLSDQQRLQAAQAEEDLQRSAVIARLAAEAGETHWVLNVKEPVATSKQLNIVQAGFADLDSRDDEASGSGEEKEEAPMGFVAGRMVFGQLKKYKRTEPEPESTSDSESSSSDDSDHEEDSYKNTRAVLAAKKESQNSESNRAQPRVASIQRNTSHKRKQYKGSGAKESYEPHGVRSLSNNHAKSAGRKIPFPGKSSGRER